MTSGGNWNPTNADSNRLGGATGQRPCHPDTLAAGTRHDNAVEPALVSWRSRANAENSARSARSGCGSAIARPTVEVLFDAETGLT